MEISIIESTVSFRLTDDEKLILDWCLVTYGLPGVKAAFEGWLGNRTAQMHATHKDTVYKHYLENPSVKASVDEAMKNG